MKPLIEYFQGAVHEIKNVAWPTEAETMRLTKITLVFLVLFTTLFFLSDSVLNTVFGFIYSLV